MSTMWDFNLRLQQAIYQEDLNRKVVASKAANKVAEEEHQKNQLALVAPFGNTSILVRLGRNADRITARYL